MEFPNYGQKVSKRYIGKFKDFTFKNMKPDVMRSERVYKTKNLDYYQKEVLEDSKKMKEEVMVVMAIQKADIDIRVLNYLFRYLQKVNINTDSIPVEVFTKVWRSLIGRESAYTHPNLERKLVNVIIEDGGEISIHKLSKLVEISEFIPVRVKKDKNYSKDIQVIMSSGSQGG
jgi:hypothetical protein